MSNDPMLEMFIFENNQLTDRLEEILMQGESDAGFDEDAINEIFRNMHTIKGSSAMMSFDNISTLAHSIEDMFFFIREHHDCTPDWKLICDLVLQSVDFFKEQVTKIQNGSYSKEEATALLASIHDYMPRLTGAAPDPVKAAPAPEPAASAGTAPAQADGAPTLTARVFFEDGCKMENIRAYQIVNAISGICTSIVTDPPDFLEECTDQIVNHGAVFFIHSDHPVEEIKQKLSECLFVKSIEFDDETPLDLPAPVSAPAAEPPAPEPAVAPAPAVQPQTEAAPPPTPVAAEPAPAPVSAPDTKKAAPASDAPVKQSYISVNVEKLDRLLELVGEIVIAEAMVTKNPDLQGLNLENFEAAAAMLRKNTDELQDVVMSVRMIPVSGTFHKMHRIVRDLIRKIDKEVELTIAGEETELDKNIIDNLSDPLMHIIRNSMDHGIEATVEERVAAGKPLAGRIQLEARNAGGDVIISITDDGRGLNRDKILKKAIDQGLVTKPESELTDKEIYNFIMLPGFSTKDQVTELSGRGVGMDVVKKNIEKIGGQVSLDSSPGKGMTVNIKIPLTLAILNGMEIQVGHNIYIVPTLNIRESFKPQPENIIIDPDGNEMVMIRGEIYPIIKLYELFKCETEITRFEDGIMLMGEDEGRTIGVFADQLVGEQQVVVKPIPQFILQKIGNIKGISGCTILGNGNISLIVDIKALFD